MWRNRAWELSGGLTEPGTGQREAADAISLFPSHTTGTDTSFKRHLEVTFLKPTELHFNHWSSLEPRILKFFPLLASSKWTLRFGKPQIVHVFPLPRRNLSLDLLRQGGRNNASDNTVLADTPSRTTSAQSGSWATCSKVSSTSLFLPGGSMMWLMCCCKVLGNVISWVNCPSGLLSIWEKERERWRLCKCSEV